MRIALVGDPIGGSVSPDMHRAAFAAAGLEASYHAVTVRAGALAEAWPMLVKRFAGLNVTRPLKEEVIPLLDAVEPAAARAGSVNTVVFEARGAVGHSTDGPGFLAALRLAGVTGTERALVLGTGGGARAVAAALAWEGTEVLVLGRNAQAGQRLASDLGRAAGARGRVAFAGADAAALLQALDSVDLLVNATPLGSWTGPEASPIPDEAQLRPHLCVADLVYRPRRTLLLERAAAAGCTVVEGIEMLIEQGARSFEIWTGAPAPREAMRAAAYRALRREPAGAAAGAPG